MKDPDWRKCILRADSRDVIKRIPDNSVDFILTDPHITLVNIRQAIYHYLDVLL